MVVGSSKGLSSSYIGAKALSNSDLLLSYPVEHGIGTKWDDMQKIWHHTLYDQLQVAPEEQALLITESVLNPNKNREKSAEIFFETFGVPAFNIEKQALLLLFASGYSTGLAVQSGEGVTEIVPVVEGNIDKNAVMVFDVAGRTITEVLAKKK
ncbi:actin [Mortierella antarctica]|nr:actin [Mortierella antarctica]